MQEELDGPRDVGCYFVPQPELRSIIKLYNQHYVTRNPHKTDTYISKWMLAALKKNGNGFRIFERRALRMIYGPVNDNGTRRTRCCNVLYTLYDELDIVKVIKTGNWDGWDTTLKRKNLIVAESVLFLNQKALDV